MMLSQILKTRKPLIILVVAELIACAALGFVAWNKHKEIKNSEELTNTLMQQLSDLEKSTVPAEDYNTLVKHLQLLKITVQTMALTSSGQPMERPEQICGIVKQILMRQQQTINSATSALSAMSASSPAGEVDFLVSVVEKAIAQQGVVDTQQTEKFALTLYHMQKVLDGIGYKLNDTVKTTNQAVLKFQTDNQLKADGKIGSKTWAKVRDAWNAKRPGGPMPSATAPTQSKPQTQSTTTTKPITTRPTSPTARPSLSSVTTRSTVRP